MPWEESSVTGLRIQSKTRPVLAQSTNPLILNLVIKDKDSNFLHHYVFSEILNTWNRIGMIPNIQSNETPALTLFNNRIHMVCKDPSGTVWHMNFNETNGNWSRPIRLRQVTNVNTPFLLVARNRLFLLYSLGNSISISEFRHGRWTSPRQIKTLNGRANLSATYRPDPQRRNTLNYRYPLPAITSDENNLHLITVASAQNLGLAGTDRLVLKTWHLIINPITARVSSMTPIFEGEIVEPELHFFNGVIHLIHKNVHHSNSRSNQGLWGYFFYHRFINDVWVGIFSFMRLGSMGEAYFLYGLGSTQNRIHLVYLPKSGGRLSHMLSNGFSEFHIGIKSVLPLNPDSIVNPTILSNIANRNTWLNNCINATNQTFNQIGVRVVEIAPRDDDSLQGELRLYSLSVGKCIDNIYFDRFDTTGEQNQLFRYRNGIGRTDLAVYIVRQLTGNFAGCSTHPNGRPGCVIADQVSQWVLPHEIGHLLGLKHERRNRNRLMFPTAGAITNPPPDITNGEVVAIGRSPYIHV